MKLASNITVLSVARTLEIVKRPKAKNLNTGNVSISYKEKQQVGENDSVVLKVLNPEEEIIATKTYTSKQFHRGLVERSKRTKSGFTIKYFTLEY